ncbi:MAG: EH signature domain-containing protein [Candidatus Accumulibacter necessarius]
MLDLLDGKSDVQLIGNVVVRCLALILVRYAGGKDRPEHARLRDLAVERIGNPWLKRTAWDAHVRNDEARKMVDGWLKRRLITDFFALLSEDGAADQRRLNYWLRFEPVIEDMWFALGPHARTTNTTDFRDMRKRMEGRLHYLDGQGSPYNNAFIMRIGSFMVAEFGVTGNATYIYNAKDLKLDSMRRRVSIHELKVDNHVARLIHKADWEGAFDAWLLPRIGWKPQTRTTGNSRSVDTYLRPVAAATVPEPRRPPATPKSAPTMEAVYEVIRAHHLKVDDRRPKKGAFWILHNDADLTVNAQLLRLGFRYKARQGWWKE